MKPRTRRSFLHTSLAAAAAAGFESTAHSAQASVPDCIYLKPSDKAYEKARLVYNSTLLDQPGIIALCQNEQGVTAALLKGREKKLPVAIKAGGHSFEGFCLNDGGLVVNVSPMKKLSFDGKSGVLTAGPGNILSEVNKFLLAKKRLLPAGSCAGVGLAGSTLGGGYGLFARKFGLTCDHLISARMVDAEGKVHDTKEDDDLLWALRGGGNGNFGVVTEMKFRTQPAPETLCAFKFRAFKLNAARATSLLEAWFDAAPILPMDAFSAFVLNGNFLSILITTVGSREQKGLKSFLAKLGKITDKSTSAKPSTLQKALPWYYGEPGPLPFKNASGGYYKGFEDLKPALPGILQEVFKLPGLIFQVNTLGGKIASGPPSAYPHREYPFLGEWQSYWDHESQRASLLEAVAKIRDHLAEAGITRHYANYPDKAYTNWQTGYYGDEGYKRLQAIKSKFDPDNIFQHAQSVKPA